MSWNYQGNGGGYNRGFSRAPYNNSYQGAPSGNYRRSYAPKKKHSGAKYLANTKNGKPVITAWNYSRRLGLVNVLVAPYNGSHIVESKSGRSWAVWMAKITGKGFSDHFPVLVDLGSKKAIIRKYGWVVNPSAANGGYCGQFSKR